MKSTFHRTEKPLSEFETANLIDVEENYLGLYLSALIDKSTVPSNWNLYYIQAGKTNITVMDKIPARHFAGCLLLEHPYELKGFFSRKKLHSEDYAIIEPVDIKKYIGMECPSDDYTYEDMAKHGYEWDGMYPLTGENVRDICLVGEKMQVPVYILNSDNTEFLAEIKENDFMPDIKHPEIMYGIQKPDWYHEIYRADDEETEEEN